MLEGRFAGERFPGLPVVVCGVAACMAVDAVVAGGFGVAVDEAVFGVEDGLFFFGGRDEFLERVAVAVDRPGVDVVEAEGLDDVPGDFRLRLSEFLDPVGMRLG